MVDQKAGKTVVAVVIVCKAEAVNPTAVVSKAIVVVSKVAVVIVAQIYEITALMFVGAVAASSMAEEVELIMGIVVCLWVVVALVVAAVAIVASSMVEQEDRKAGMAVCLSVVAIAV